MLRWLRRLGFSVFSKAFLGALGFSQVFFSFLWSHRAFSKFLGFPVLLGTLRGAFGYLRGPFVSFGVPLGSPWCALGPPFGRCGSLWHPLGVALGSPLGYLWGLYGRFGVTWAAWGCLGVPKDVENQKTHVPLGSLWSLWGHLGCPGLPGGAQRC